EVAHSPGKITETWAPDIGATQIMTKLLTPRRALRAREQGRWMLVPFFPLCDWVNAAGLLLMLSACSCAAAPAPRVAAPPPGQARIWFYRLWNPSESLNVANIDMNGVYVGSVEPGGAFYRDVAPGGYHIAPQNQYIDYNENTNVVVVPG